MEEAIELLIGKKVCVHNVFRIYYGILGETLAGNLHVGDFIFSRADVKRIIFSTSDIPVLRVRLK